jgi:hypothetical protein
MGDRCITEDLVTNYIDTKKTKLKIINLCCAFIYYAEKVGLEILDGCFMMDSKSDIVWSEINPDCMRVKKIENAN